MLGKPGDAGRGYQTPDGGQLGTDHWPRKPQDLGARDRSAVRCRAVQPWRKRESEPLTMIQKKPRVQRKEAQGLVTGGSFTPAANVISANPNGLAPFYQMGKVKLKAFW